MGFIHALIARMAQEHGIDTKHVFVFAYFEMAGRWPFAWPLRRPTRSPPSRPSAPVFRRPRHVVVRSAGPYGDIMLANGTLDPINPYEGGKVTIFDLATVAVRRCPHALPPTNLPSVTASRQHQRPPSYRISMRKTRPRSIVSPGPVATIRP